MPNDSSVILGPEVESGTKLLVLQGSQVVLCSSSRGLVARDVPGLRVRWSVERAAFDQLYRHEPDPLYVPLGTLAVSADKKHVAELVECGGGAKLTSYDIATGNVRWSHALPKPPGVRGVGTTQLPRWHCAFAPHSDAFIAVIASDDAFTSITVAGGDARVGPVSLESSLELHFYAFNPDCGKMIDSASVSPFGVMFSLVRAASTWYSVGDRVFRFEPGSGGSREIFHAPGEVAGGLAEEPPGSGAFSFCRTSFGVSVGVHGPESPSVTGAIEWATPRSLFPGWITKDAFAVSDDRTLAVFDRRARFLYAGHYAHTKPLTPQLTAVGRSGRKRPGLLISDLFTGEERGFFPSHPTIAPRPVLVDSRLALARFTPQELATINLDDMRMTRRFAVNQTWHVEDVAGQFLVVFSRVARETTRRIGVVDLQGS